MSESTLNVEQKSTPNINSESPELRDSVSYLSAGSEIDKENTTVAENGSDKKNYIVITFLGLQIALFLSALDSTIVSTILTRIGSDFNEASIVSWVATSYILTFDIFQPLFSKFSDIFGRKWILISGICVFLLGSLLCALANNMIMLIVSRAIAGIGGGGIFSMVFIIIADLVPLEKRGAYQGIVNAVFAISSVCGPLIGGTFTDYVSWRWNFYINLPIGAVALVLLLFYLRLPVPQGSLLEKLKKIDYFGAATILTFSTLFLLAMNFGGQTFPWKSAAVIVPLVLTVILIACFIYIESKVTEPLMPLRLFKNRSISLILAANWFFGMAFFSLVYYLPVYFQVVRGDSAMWSGIRLIPMQLLIAVFSSIGGLFISKFGIYKPILVTGMGLVTLGTGLVSLFNENTQFSQIYGFAAIGGAGIGFMFSSAIIALQACASQSDVAVVTGLGNFSRILGGALGVAISSAVLNSSLTQDLSLIIPEDVVKKVIDSSVYIRNGCPPEYVEAIISGYVDALKLVWYVMVSMACMSFCLTLFVQSGTVFKNQTSKEPVEQFKDVSSRDETIIIGEHTHIEKSVQSDKL